MQRQYRHVKRVSRYLVPRSRPVVRVTAQCLRVKPVRLGRHISTTHWGLAPFASDFETSSIDDVADYKEDMGQSENPANDPKAQALLNLQYMLGLRTREETSSKFQDVVFVCIDCEAFEFNPKHTTEIGVSVLDTREIRDLPPGERGEAWISKIQSAHYRPVEYGHEINEKHVKGCPDSFQFGPTTWIRRADAIHVLRRIFEDPTNLTRAADFEHQVSNAYREVVLVTHSSRDDASHLRQIGFDMNSAPNVVEKMDTQWLISSKKQQASLIRLLRYLKIEPKDLHNAGNDAAFTMQALLLIALRENAVRGSVAAGLREVLDQKPVPKPLPAELTGEKAIEIWAGTAVKPVALDARAKPFKMASGRARRSPKPLGTDIADQSSTTSGTNA